MAAVAPPALGVGVEDDMSRMFQQRVDGFFTDDGRWAEDPNQIGQRMNLIMMMVHRVLTSVVSHETHAVNQN